jgi:hypothetical protein
MKWVIKAVVLVAILVAAFFLLRTKVLWLDSFDATIIQKVEKVLPTVVDQHAQKISSFFFDVVTDGDNRELTVEVDQLQYFRAREGMRVTKESFGLDVRLLE